jgi:hypothetical protein
LFPLSVTIYQEVPLPSPDPTLATLRRNKDVQRSRTRIPPAIKTRFLYLVFDPSGPRLPAQAAAAVVGISKASASRLVSGARQSPGTDAKRFQLDLPAPKTWDQLSADAQEALRDINVFRELFFARRPQVWVRDGAMRIVEALDDTSRRTFIDMNVFPGAGKSTFGLDLGCWLMAGGGFCDPAYGRALRLMYGSRVMATATHMTSRIRGFLELRRPFFDKERRQTATHVLAKEYGRFKPGVAYGEETLWAREQFTVAQLEDIDLYEKEPTVQAASRQSGFLGERVNLAWWDDLVHTTNCRTIEIANELDEWFEDEAETRVEPGGVLALVGQRLSPRDLHHKRLDKVVTDPDGTERQLYVHIVYPAHHDKLCDAAAGGEHRQWTGEHTFGAGCMTDIGRLSVSDWTNVKSKANYRLVYQEEDIDVDEALIQPEWWDGGVDLQGYAAAGSLDRDRAFGEHPPADVGRLVNYATVDPSNENFWAIEWWAYQPESRFNYLIWGERKRMWAGGERGLLDWNNEEQRFIGMMEEMQMSSVSPPAHPIRVWVIETNVAQRQLLRYDHFQRWLRRWPDVAVLTHQTQTNKWDPDWGVSILSTRYKTGHKRIPAKPGTGAHAAAFLRVMRQELTTFPGGETDDIVIADWMGETNLPRILAAAKKNVGQQLAADASLPPYLRDRQHDIETITVG